jgi:hypothetical protein
VISVSGGSVAAGVIAGSAVAHRAHWTATARFHVPQSGQNRVLPSELQSNEVVGRPGAGELDIDGRVALAFGRHRIGERAPP